MMEGQGAARRYRTYMESRPAAAENFAIEMLIRLCRATGCLVHVVHLASSEAVQMLRALKAIGVQLAVDDFGVGYSSFSYLRKFPLDALKVDRSFINDISSNPDNATILSALIGIGKSLKHRVVDEGVETEEQLHFLQKEGCSEGQGYFFCRPVIADKFAEFLERGVSESMVH